MYNSHSKLDKTKILMTNGNLMKVKSNAECSPWSILQCFWPELSDNWSRKPICVFRVAVLHRFYCTSIAVGFVCKQQKLNHIVLSPALVVGLWQRSTVLYNAFCLNYLCIHSTLNRLSIAPFLIRHQHTSQNQIRRSRWRRLISFCTVCLHNVLLKFECNWNLFSNNP